jgi:hypothetical protein
MYLYQKIDDESILLDRDCKRMLKRTSRKLLIDEVMEKINKNEEKLYNKEYEDDTDVSIESFDSVNSMTYCITDNNVKDNNVKDNCIKDNKIYNKYEKSNKTFYELILTICGCNNSNY